MTKFPRWALALATAGVLFLVACSDEQPTEAGPPRDPTASLQESVSPDPAPRVLGAGTEALPAGTYVLDLDRDLSEERIPNLRITVPDGWANLDGWVVHSGEGTDHFVGITFWDVDEVYAHPCHWLGPMIQPGPTVADLATALAKQPLRDATEPVDIVVDGFEGVQLEWSVPADMVTGTRSSTDFVKCDEDEFVGDRPFKSWTGVPGSWGGSERYQQGPGQVDRLWILNVDGDRLVIDAMYMPTTDAKDRMELWQVMESIRFET